MQDLGLLLLRIVAGVTLAAPGFVTALKKMGVPNPEAAATASGLAVALSLCLTGPGRLSVDHLMRLT